MEGKNINNNLLGKNVILSIKKEIRTVFLLE